MYWWFIIISILLFKNHPPWWSTMHYFRLNFKYLIIIEQSCLLLCNTFFEWISGLKIIYQVITTSNALRCSKNRLPLDKDNVIQRSFSIFERVCQRTFQFFFSFEFSIIDVQHRSGFRPLRRVSPKKYQPSASWCWFGTHVQNCCHWKKKRFFDFHLITMRWN